jgi:iron complex transport system substrate-binding protein
VLAAAIAAARAGAGDAALEGAAATRVITLSPDLAELVWTAGAGALLVGTIEHSDYPPQARAVPRVGDAYGLDFERIGSLRPDLILAWEGGTPQRWIERLRELDYRVVPLGVRRLEDVAGELEQIGELTGQEARARSESRRYLARLTELRDEYRGADPVTVFFEISGQPLYTVGGPHVITAMIELCGGRNVFEDLQALAADVSPESVLGRDPQVILAADDSGADTLDEWRRWPALAAVSRGDLYLVRADLVTRSSTRILDGAGEICATLERARARTHDDSRHPHGD